MAIHAVVLAAGKGTRMRSDLAKVLHVAAGKTLLDWTLDALSDLALTSVALVAGHQAPAVSASVADHQLAPLVATALQAEQLGTGHAAAIGLAAIQPDPDDTIVVVPGDMPLLHAKTIRRLVASHIDADADVTIAIAEVDDATGYGRIKRRDGRVFAIIEQADATAGDAAIREVNTSVYAFRAERLSEMLAKLGTTNAQGEQYLTDVVGMLADSGHTVSTFAVAPYEAMGVNTTEQLEAAAVVLADRAR